ncbi:MAG TPA: lantibiotic dehydratase [Candidatus Polarisedimenticolaceae bacterium]|nr:lantibiotic dehydratase [Candidatus Polarisedimenticolaceae bacterium]
MPVPSGFFVLRTPLLSFDELLAWGAPLSVPSAGDDVASLEVAANEDRARLRAGLAEVYRRPEIREALFLASSALESRLATWEPGADADQDLDLALVRYFERMAARPTPFGLFAGITVGALGSTSELSLGSLGQCRRHTRLDMGYVTRLTQTLAERPEVHSRLTFRPNSSLYPVAGRLRYAEWTDGREGRSYRLVAVDRTDYLDAALARARHGATLAAIAEAVAAAAGDVDAAETAAFVDELVAGRLLVADLEPAVTGGEAGQRLVEHLRQHLGPTAIDATLERVGHLLAELDASGVGASPQRYTQLARELEPLGVEVDPSRLVQVDLTRMPVSAVLDDKLAADLLRGTEILRRLDLGPASDGLQSFRDAFVARYGTREVPLVLALDEDVGIGFDGTLGPAADRSPLLQGLAIGAGLARPADAPAPHPLLVSKWAEATRIGAVEITLDDRDVEALAPADTPPYPLAFSISARIAARTPEALARGDYQIHLYGAHGPSGARLLGRFCTTDERLRCAVENHLREEEARSPGAVFCEVVHLPEGSLGNVLLRPVLRDYEIPYLGRSGAPSDRQIPITDLMLRVEPGGRIVLRSQRLDREILPRLSTAHNFIASCLPIYRFLGVLQSQSVAQIIGWSWGSLELAPFLPRVRYGRLVFSRARWELPTEFLDPQRRQSPGALLAELRAWRRRGNVPRRVVLGDNDQELFVDLDNVLSVEALLDVVRGRKRAILVELFPGPGELCVSSPEGAFVHELVVPFVAPQRPASSSVAGRRARVSAIERSLTPGSDWLYVKLYTGTAAADTVLREIVAPLAARAQSNGAVDRWFFIRYGDPDWHLRLRFHGAPARLLEETLPELQRAVVPLLDNGLVWRMQLDTYERELERYGGADAIEDVERLFHADSEAVLAVLSEPSVDGALDARWKLALAGMDLLLEDFGFDLSARLALARQLREESAREFRVGKRLRIQLGSKFRAERGQLESLERLPGIGWLRERSQAHATPVARLRQRAEAGQLEVSLPDLACSVMHMHANRLLRSAQRQQELVLYDFLARLYESQHARRARVTSAATAAAR